ncbi:uncharacterized protein F4807DRAFT_434623 [Annulohypoxylon truncatum]|uniref:uncharacterized protein n=1 Tax=Annulohypoxylon truncatum TaxID=327061 RepID=UPI00200852EB|nr:uncharacterized protein F4807DRAFT_434623 [Annulohypoxylon truncatum]KAI1207440.1 hypothetical protein F4807DRAFT_434623 [Annulohypoxylon truncatum]
MSSTEPLDRLPFALSPNGPASGEMILGVTWAFTSMTIIALIFRLLLHAGRFGLDDWFMVAAEVCQVVFQGLVTIQLYWGLEWKQDGDPNTHAEYIQYMKYGWIASTPAILVSVLARISATLLLNRLFASKKWLRWYLYVFTTVETCVGTLAIISIWLQTTPIEATWNVTMVGYARPGLKTLVPVSVVLGQVLFTISDLTHVLFPVIIVWKLNMRPREKLLLIMMLALSLTTMIASILKLVTSSRSMAQSGKALLRNPDVSTVYICVEQCLAIIMGCIPKLRHIAKLRRHPIFASFPKKARSRSQTIEEGTSRENLSYQTYHETNSRGRQVAWDGSTGSREVVNPNLIVVCAREENDIGLEMISNDGIRRVDEVTITYDRKTEP